MIEIPEAVVLACQIKATLTGRMICNVVANHTPHSFAWYSGDPANYDRQLSGKIITDALAVAGNLEIHADDMVLAISTPIRYHASGEKLPQKHQLLVEFSGGSAFSCTVQMWGGMFCFHQGEKGGFPDYDIAKEKPSPLSEDFDRAYFAALFDEETGKQSAKEFLATKQRIPGLGNGVLQDILWTARIHPKRKMETLSPAEIDGMFDAIKTVLYEMTIHGGRDTERDLFGCPGGYRTVLSKNTVSQPCPACGSMIKKQPYLGGSIYVCEGCQKIDE